MLGRIGQPMPEGNSTLGLGRICRAIATERLAKRRARYRMGGTISRAQGAMEETDTTHPRIPRALSQREDAVAAAGELHDALGRHDLALVLLFCSPDYDLRALAIALRELFGDTVVVGCTTAGEITPFGYMTGTATAIGFPRAEFSAVIDRIDGVADFQLADVAKRGRAALARVEAESAHLSGETQTVALLLADGLAATEELIVSTLHDALGGLPLVGGSAADGLRFAETHVLEGGHFHRDAALLILLTTSRKFSVFRSHHFTHTDRKMVVTGADPARRVVTEINAEPAAQEYARLVGLGAEPLNPMIFAAHPVMVRAGGQYFIRAIQKVEDDGSLKFFCAIDEGLVLTVAEGIDVIGELEAMFARIEAEIGEPDLVIGFDCVLRHIEIEQKQLRRSVSALLAAHDVVGFCTYGEQYNAMHLNQTLTGIAIGR
jgi:hypothetical protein